MSFRTSLGLILGVTFALSFGFIILSVAFLRSELTGLFPPELALQTDNALHMLLLGQVAGLLIFALVALVAVFFVIVNLFERPLRSLAATMDAYALRGERIPFDQSNASKEIRSIADSFAGMVDRVEQGQSRDREISRVKSDFITTAAHQFRTPLTGMRWALEALEKEPLNESQKMLVKSALDKGQDLVAIVGTLLDIASIESGKYAYTFAPTNIGVVAEAVVKEFSDAATKSKVSLFFVPPESEIPLVRADKERITWVLNTLIENAIRYTLANGSVRVSLEAGSGRVYVRVKDTGIGIASDDRANIFERFYRGKNAVDKENQGNGLGLSIARTVATDHGGELNFAPNTEGAGTTFTLSLPLAG